MALVKFKCLTRIVMPDTAVEFGTTPLPDHRSRFVAWAPGKSGVSVVVFSGTSGIGSYFEPAGPAAVKQPLGENVLHRNSFAVLALTMSPKP
jgi:hypothetical protein